MPLLSPKAALTPANQRASDVAQLLTETIAPIQQQKTLAAFRVQGIQAILYNKLSQGRPCVCNQHNHTVTKLSADGKMAEGAINRAITGNSNFGVGPYNPQQDLDSFSQGPTSASAFNSWLGDLTKAGTSDDDQANLITEEAVFEDDGQSSPDLEDMFGDFDLSKLGITDVSCPICFGNGYIGGYSPFRAFRQVFIHSDFQTNSTIDFETFALTPGTHTLNTVLPRGVTRLDVFRPMNGKAPIPFSLKIDGTSTTGRNPRQWFDGRPHTIEITTQSPMTHLEIQCATSKEPIWFELPRRAKSQDIALLERQEPFQIIVSPDVPQLDALDILADNEYGKILIVQSVTPWTTKSRRPMGWTCQVRVAQPQELYNILPFRTPVTGLKPSQAVRKTETTLTSGLSAGKGFEF